MSEIGGAIDVSVIVLSYCHEKYIAQALDSILMQETSLRYEVLVGDDFYLDKRKLQKQNTIYSLWQSWHGSGRAVSAG